MTIFALLMCWSTHCLLYPRDNSPMLFYSASECDKRIEPLGLMMANNWMSLKSGEEPEITCVQKSVNTWEPVK